jgi:HEAT repeat protein
VEGRRWGATSEGWRVQWETSQAAVLLAGWADPRAIDPLLEGLADNDPAVRMYGTLGLGNIGDHRAVDALLLALQDPVFGVRGAAAGALRSQ